jgi:hypothetical protein
MKFSCWFRARDHRGLDGDRPAGDERRRTRVRAAAPAEDGEGQTFLFPRGRGNPGEESLASAVAAQTFEAKPVSGQITPREVRVSRAEQQRREKHWLVSDFAFKITTLEVEE